jgi:crooked neck
MPELVWKAYIDFEYALGNWSRVRSLYRRLLDRSCHPKVWRSFAIFEYGAPNYDAVDGDERVDESTGEEAGGKGSEDGYVRARSVFDEGYKSLKDQGLKEEVTHYVVVVL